MTTQGISTLLSALLRREGIQLRCEVGASIDEAREREILGQIAELVLDSAALPDPPADAPVVRRPVSDRRRTQPVPVKTIAHLVELTR